MRRRKKKPRRSTKKMLFRDEMFRRRMQEELKIQEMKLQMTPKEYEKRDKIVNEERVNVKLHKLVITKIDGTSLDWFYLWNQFESEIDKAEIGPVSMFSYLKKLLIPIVRLLIYI